MKTRTATDSLTHSAIHLGSGLAGMVVGSAVGRPSFIVGLLTMLGGAYYRKDWVTTTGVGMIVSNGFAKKPATTNGIGGVQDELDDAKGRAVNSLKALGKKLYLDKFSTSLAQKMNLGNIEDRPLVFMGSEVADQGDFDTSEVDDIIQRIENGESLPTVDINDQDIYDDLDAIPVGYHDGEDLFLEGTPNEDIIELNAIA